MFDQVYKGGTRDDESVEIRLYCYLEAIKLWPRLCEWASTGHDGDDADDDAVFVIAGVRLQQCGILHHVTRRSQIVYII